MCFLKAEHPFICFRLAFPQPSIDFSEVLLPISRSVRFKYLLEAWHMLTCFSEKG